MTISSHEEKPFKITDITSTIDDKINYELSAIEKDESYSLVVKTHPTLKEDFRGEILLKTNSQRKPEIKLSILGKLKKEVKVSPEYLYFGIINPDKELIDPNRLKRTVLLSKVKGSPLTIEKTETSVDWIATQIEMNKNGGEYRVTITLDKNKLPKGEFSEKVKIHSKFNEKIEVSTVIVEGKVI